MKAKSMNFLNRLSRDEMSTIMGGYDGGVTKEEYCNQNRLIRESCCQRMDNADDAYDQHCT